MIKVILWDIDGTLLNFDAAESYAIRKCFEIFGMGVCTDEMIAHYSVINRTYWERLERGEISKQEVLVGRYREFFATEGLPVENAEAFNTEYQLRLGDYAFFYDNAYELVKKLKTKVKQYAVTNGTLVAQERKLEKSELNQLLDGVFISDVLGVEKPNVGFFTKVFEAIGDYEKDEVLIVGDSLTSDIQGGNHAGIRCCWYNPKQLKDTGNRRIDYEIRDLWEVEKIIEE